MRRRFTLREMHCAACQANVEKILRELDGVKQYRVNLLKGYADIEFKEKKVSQERVEETLTAAGYPCELAPDQPEKISFSEKSEELDLRAQETAVSDLIQRQGCSLAESVDSAEEIVPAASDFPDLKSESELPDSEGLEIERIEAKAKEEAELPVTAGDQEAELPVPDDAQEAELPRPNDEQEAEPSALEDKSEAESTVVEETEPDSPATNEAERFREIDRQAEMARRRQRELHDPLLRQEAELKKRLIASTILLIPLIYFMLEMIPALNLPLPTWMQGDLGAANRAFAQLLLTMPILFINRAFFKSGFRALWRRHPNMDSLVALGAGSAFLYGVIAIFRLITALMHQDEAVLAAYAHQLYLDSAATIVTLISLGKLFELRAKRKTSSAVESLLDLAPAACSVIIDGEEQRLPAADVEIGSEIILRPGERIALDGLIVEGRSSFDEQALTGESMPVDKEVGDRIFAGTINQNGVVIYRSLKRSNDTVLAEIVEVVENAAASKAEMARLADRVAAVFVPVVMGIALLTFIIWQLLRGDFEFSMNMAISVLLISCPCALGLATPVAIMVAGGRAARDGILIKGAESLEMVNQISDLALDKTGTLTLGRPEIVAIEPDPATELSELDLLKLAASIEAGSSHPLAHAVMSQARELNLSTWPQEASEALPGRGVFARIYGENYFAGNLALLEEAGLSSPELEQLTERVAAQGYSALLIFSEDRYLGLLAASDQIKQNAPWAIRALTKTGLDLVLLSGDHRRAAEAIARRLDLAPERVIPELLPRQKAELIRERQAAGKKVAMLGDGINDAPALVSADLGIAVGAGTDIALDSADVVLMRSDLGDLLTFFELGKKTVQVMKQNLFWAFFYNVLGIPLAAGVFYPLFGWKLNPIYAAIAMSLSSIFVVSNALRLRNFIPSWQKNGELEPLHESGREEPKAKRENPLKKRPREARYLEAKSPTTSLIDGVERRQNTLELSPEEVDSLEAEAETTEPSESYIEAQELESMTEVPAFIAESEAEAALKRAEERAARTEEQEERQAARQKEEEIEAAFAAKLKAQREIPEPARSAEKQSSKEELIELEILSEDTPEAQTPSDNAPGQKNPLGQSPGPSSPEGTDLWSALYADHKPAESEKCKLKIDGMHCSSCAQKLALALQGIPGLSEITVDHELKEARFIADGEPDLELIRKTISACGYKLRYMVSPK